MRLRTHRGARRFRPGGRGATITEYAIILFVVAVVAGAGFRFFGKKLEGGVGAAGSNLETQSPSSAATDTAGGAGGGVTTTHGAGAGAGGGSDPSAGFGGPRAPLTATEGGSSFAKFAMIALGIIGAAAAFFAAMKGKHAR